MRPGAEAPGTPREFNRPVKCPVAAMTGEEEQAVPYYPVAGPVEATYR
jgi:hypothetical protein